MTLDPAAVVGPHGWTTWEELTARVSRSTVTAWVATGALVRLHPGVYATPPAAFRWRVRLESALRSWRAVAGSATALALWGLVPPPPGPLHLLVAAGRSGRGSSGVVLSRTRDLAECTRRVDGLPVACVERAVVDCWGRPGPLGRPAVRAAAITAVRERLCSVRELTYELARRPSLPGRATLVRLVQLLADGCRSELEIWGCIHVLRAPGMPAFVQQRRVTVGAQTFLLDAACEEVLLAVEMDGAAYHGSRTQRERDLRRDALLATAGWQTLRFSHARLTSDPEACRRDIRAAYHARRRLMGLGGVR